LSYYIAEPPIDEAVESLFELHDKYLEMGLPTYIVSPRGVGDERELLKEAFKRLVGELKPLGYIPKLRPHQDRYVIVLSRKRIEEGKGYGLNLLLLVATAATVFVDGYIRSSNPVLTRVLMPGLPIYLNALLFTSSILGIFGLHELGHKLAALYKGVKTSMPFFIPAPPGMGGTFGAVITQREPPANRDDLFDIGFSGPAVGLLVSIIVAIIGLRLSFIVPAEEVLEWSIEFPGVRVRSIPFPLLLSLLASLLRPTPRGMVLILHPLAFAAWVGCIVTFINLIPSWQLDGGHICRALLGRERHRRFSIIGVFILLVSGYFLMAIMLALFMMWSRSDDGAPLDEVSPLSLSRKMLSLLYVGMVVFTFVLIAPL
jgi:membrane-associated protease RseP (regulator of RpoE activity)